MKVLVINCGSSSLKYQLYDMPDRVALSSEDDVDELGSLDVLEGNAWTVPTLVGKTLLLRDRSEIVALALP